MATRIQAAHHLRATAQGGQGTVCPSQTDPLRSAASPEGLPLPHPQRKALPDSGRPATSRIHTDQTLPRRDGGRPSAPPLSRRRSRFNGEGDFTIDAVEIKSKQTRVHRAATSSSRP